MLEGLVATLLNRFLGMYVKNFDANQLQVGIWNGEVSLKNMELRREALDQLKLPVNVVEGHVGTLTLTLPLSNLRGKPVKVNIDEVFLLAAPKEDAAYDEGEEKKRAQAVKMEKLENAELLKERSAAGMSQEEQQKNSSFMDSLITAIVDNIQISVKNIHLRYEDAIAAPGHPFALGVTLKEFSAVSTDENWRPTWIQSSSSTTHKLATLGSLSVYWNTDAELLGTGKGTDTGPEAQKVAHHELVDKFRQLLDKEDNRQYMLKPVSGRAAVEVDKTGKSDRPRFKARLLFQEFGLVLDEDQYRDALMMVDLFHYFARHQEYKKHRPEKTPKEDPKAWLKFAGEAVLRKIQNRNRQWTWDYMHERKEDRNKYIALFKKKKAAQKLTASEQTDMTALEEKLTYEDLRFFRSLARSQLRKENVGVKKEQPQKQTWSEWVWGGGKQDQSQKPEEEQRTEITEDERKELYNAIDWDEKKAIAESIDAPRDSVKLQVESSLRAGSFTLKRDPHGASTDILKLVFDKFHFKGLQRPDSMLADMSLGGLRLYDGTTEGSLFPQIVKVKDRETQPKESLDENAEDDDEDEKQVIKSPVPKDSDDDELFHLVFEKNPLDESADSAISMKLKSIEVIYNPRFVEEIAKFFKPPERHMESIGALMETAGATVEGLRQQTRAGLEFALQEHQTVNAQLDIQAPLIIVPESVTKKSTLCLILDAGHVALNSDLVDKETMRDIQSKQKTQYNEEDFKQLEGLMYDKFLLKLNSTQVLIGPGVEATKAQLESDSKENNFHIIDRINMDFVLETSIIPKASDLTKTRISGNLPVLHASISDRKYKNLMKLIDLAIPKFDSKEKTEVVQQSTTISKRRSTGPATRDRSKSFQMQEAKVEVVVDEDSGDEGAGKPKETKGKRKEIVNLRQRNFEFKFTVDRLQGSLYRADPNDQEKDQLLVELVAEHFELDFYQRAYDMVAEVVLKSLSVDDHIEKDPSPDFKKIITSQDVDKSENKDLFNLKFVRVQKDSPEFVSTYEGIAMNLDVSVSTINLIVTRRTLLTLLDFVLLTFATPDNASNQTAIDDKPDSDSKNLKANQVQNDRKAESDKIRIKVDLSSIALILNNDGIRLATLRLNTADVGVYLAGGCMRVDARLGSLSLVDDINQGAPEDSSLRQIMTIEGKELADFRYQTYDSNARSYPGYDSKVYLRSGSIRVNFLEEPLRKIIQFLVKFGKMQAIFNAARQAAANQAGQIQESASKMQFDVVIKTPIIVFPSTSNVSGHQDLMTAYLGEIYANNQFATVKAPKGDVSANKLSVGIHNIRLVSNFHFDDDQAEEIEMIDKVDFDFKIKYIEHQVGLDRPEIEVGGTMTPINLKISQAQVKFLLGLSNSIPGAFATESDANEEEALKELPKSTVEPAKKVSDIGSRADEDKNIASYQKPEIDSSSEVWTKVDFAFKAETIGLELVLAKDGEPIGDLDAASLSKFSINDTDIKLKMLSDGTLESELMIHSFTIRDSRTPENTKYRKIMSLINDNVKQQFMANVSISGGSERHMIATATVDSPRIILAVDYLVALSSFASTAFASDAPLDVEEDDESSTQREEDVESGLSTPVTPATPHPQSVDTANNAGMTMSFRINIEDAQIILIANPVISNSEAIVLGTKQVLLSKQNATTLQVTKVGMFLCRMDRFETSRLRVLDDFSILVSMDDRSQGKNSQITTIHVDIEPLVLRLSLRDILLALQIVNRVSEINAKEEPDKDQEPQKLKEVKASGPGSTKPQSRTQKPVSTVARSTKRTTRADAAGAKSRRSVVMKREEMNAEVQGIRVVLIGDLHELPLVDWSVKKFNVDVRDWSGAMTGDASFDTYINVFNFSKSAWEPLIEPWQLGFHLSKDQRPDRLSVDIYSHKNMELTVTSATIALASKSAEFLSSDEDVLSKPRGTDAPYRIRNYTGFDLNVWAATREEDQGSAAKLEDGQEVPWRFEDPTTMRENLSPDGRTGVVGAKLEGSGFDSIERIMVNREGETLYNLKPRQEKIQHRLLVEVKLGPDSVKYITFRSPLLVENTTQLPIELGIYSPEEGHLLKIEKILPGEGRPAPVGAAFKHSLVIRPDPGFGYTWSNERLFWKDLLKRSVRTIRCSGESGDESTPFFFQLSANYDRNDPMTNVYPYMRIRLSAAIELQNLLPYDFKYRIYDRNTKREWTNFLRKGGVTPVHVVELSHTLLLSVEMQDTVFKQSDFAVINSSGRDDYREDKLPTKDNRGIELKLKLHFFNNPDSGGAFKISVYSPYLVLNKTGMDMNIQSKSTLSAARSAAGQGARTESDSGSRKALPYLFSYPSDDRKNRAMLKIGDSSWSKPQSFDAIGSAFDAALPAPDSRSEMHVGVSVREGEGKYKLTKVVTVAPRYIIKNKISEAIQVREPGSSAISSLDTGGLLPLKYVRSTSEKQLCLCFPGVNNQWSSPFDISNVGTLHVKLAKQGQRQQLIKIEIILEDATLFLHLSIEKKHWPFSMRNESSTEFLFYQTNPNVTEDEEDRTSGWRPIRYKLPARSIMPYAWDYPAAKNKEMVLVANGKERRVKLAEIGNQIPMRIPSNRESSQTKVIDINVVAEGPTQTLVLSDYKPSKSLYKQKTGTASRSSVATSFEAKEIDSDVTFKAQLKLAGIGISLVNKHMKELLYLTLREMEIKYQDSKLYQTVGSTIKWIQIDNQLYGGIFPIILYPTVVPKTGKDMAEHPIFHAMVTRVKDDSYGVLYIKYATLLLQELTIEIDEDFIFAMLDFMKVPGASWTEEVEGKLCDEDLDIPEPKQEHQSQDVYFELLHLQPIQVNLSFVRTERINAEDTLATTNPLMFFVNIMTMSIGNVNDAPLRFNALMLENARVTISTLTNNVRSHYTQEALRQMHVILGSADFLGNPVGLFTNISSGVADIFYEPYAGLVMTDRPQELGIGIAKGATSFVKKSVFGFSDSMAKFTGSMSKGLAAATLDKEYQDQRRMSKNRNRPKHALYGITSGGNAFATSMASGIGGLARHPFEGAEKEGLQGFVKGVGKGFLGLATKPAIGAFDLASSKFLFTLTLYLC